MAFFAFGDNFQTFNLVLDLRHYKVRFQHPRLDLIRSLPGDPMRVALVTDSTSDLQARAAELGVEIVPLYVNFQGKIDRRCPGG